LYAPLNEDLLRQHGVSIVLGPEAEAGSVVAIAAAFGGKPLARIASATAISFSRSRGLPRSIDTRRCRCPTARARIVGATDATRGCKHRCRHCPIVPVYDGQFRVVPVDVVMADIRAQVEQGATHISFGDPISSTARRTRARSSKRCIANSRRHLRRDHQGRASARASRSAAGAGATGCLFVTSAVESVDDEVLAKLEKGHTRADFIAAAACAAMPD
jgi:hypothetical protein